MQLGPYAIAPRVVLAPMAGVTDKPFRMLCKRLGAGLCVSEMTISCLLYTSDAADDM
jgi:tRNA-dihydrouridine synthase B